MQASDRLLRCKTLQLFLILCTTQPSTAAACVKRSSYERSFSCISTVYFDIKELLNLQLGHLDQFETQIPNDENALDELNKWYQQGSGYPEAVTTLRDFIIKNLIPDLEVLSVHSGACVTAQVMMLIDLIGR